MKADQEARVKAGLAMTPPTTPPVVIPPATSNTATHGRTTEQIECSRRADAKNLHGLERKTFRHNCMTDLMKKF
jgi:hypothetical protein